ncbi:hypothetical protein CSE16_01300 [Solibacillus sp. R5-41]|uniref:DUF4179 domain-containing protein n=1 Tax=Solibacillus sp. R5-41 TaxID=2048654 RepID=UPI000C1295C3|nr:DUF4179 domain-containing protein [Solibacillus sp. R5-41]ATP42335.1 hypothetical protein CSE16_01300 [Solibacillus sp. R5-41]
MNCPSVDKLSQYVDHLLNQEEQQAIAEHLKQCTSCQQIVTLFEGEEQFLKETLQAPTLPDDFEAQILAQVKPYKKKRTIWMISSGVAAAAVLSVGILTVVSPSFAELIASFFSTEQVDSGYHEAETLGFVEQVNYEVTDNGLTVRVDEVMADTTRLAFTYQIIDKNGKVKNPYIENWHEKNNMKFMNNANEELPQEDYGSWHYKEGDIGFFELRTPNVTEDVILKWQIRDINGKEGNWDMEIPIPIEKALASMTILNLQNATYAQQNVSVTFEKARFSPSAMEISYTTAFTEPLKESKLSAKAFTQPDVDVAYMIKDEKGELLATNFTYGSYFGDGKGAISAIGTTSENQQQFSHKEMFVPIKTEKPSLVVAGFLNHETVEEAVKFHPSDLKNKEKDKPALIFNGEPITVKFMQKVTNTGLRMDWPFIQREHYAEIMIDYDREKIKEELDSWVLEDSKGELYTVYNSGGRLLVYGVDSLDEEFTLHLTKVVKFNPLEKPWRIPLYE